MAQFLQILSRRLTFTFERSRILMAPLRYTLYLAKMGASNNFSYWQLKKVFLLSVWTLSLVSSGYAVNQRDQAARSFQHQMDAVQQDNGNGGGNNDGNQDQSNNADSNNPNNQNLNDANGNNEENESNSQGSNENNNNSNPSLGQEQDSNNSNEMNQTDPESTQTTQKSDGGKNQEVIDLKEDVQSIMLRLDRIERKLKLVDKEKSAHHQKVNKKKVKKKHRSH